MISRIKGVTKTAHLLRALFETPTIAGLAQRIDPQGATTQDSSAPPLSPVSRAGELPLSFAQQRLWFVDQLEPNSAVYNIPFAIHLSGPLKQPVLERCLDEILRGHEVLRTTYPTVTGEPVQRIAPPQHLDLTIKDLGGQAGADCERELQQILAEEAVRPFDLSRDWLVRGVLVRLGPLEHMLVVTVHHIAADGGSIGIILRELAGSIPRSRPASPRHWRTHRFSTPTMRSGKELGCKGNDCSRNWPTGSRDWLDRPRSWNCRPIAPDRRCAGWGGICTAWVGSEITDGLSELGRSLGATLFMTLFAAFQVLLARLTGERDLVVGIPVEGRSSLETEELVGLFVNLLPLRTDLSDNPTFIDLIGRVRDAALEAYTHQESAV